MIPTLPTLSNICRVYGVGLSYFFADATKHTLAITRKAHLLGNGRAQESVRQIPLHAADANACLVARIVELPSGQAGTMTPPGNSICGVVYQGAAGANAALHGLHDGDVIAGRPGRSSLWRHYRFLLGRKGGRFPPQFCSLGWLHYRRHRSGAPPAKATQPRRSGRRAGSVSRRVVRLPPGSLRCSARHIQSAIRGLVVDL